MYVKSTESKKRQRGLYVQYTKKAFCFHVPVAIDPCTPSIDVYSTLPTPPMPTIPIEAAAMS